MPQTSHPHIKGFDLPAQVGAQPDPSAPFIALLDTVPTTAWAKVFRREAAVLPDGQRLAEIRLDGDRIVCEGPALDPRELTLALRRLVERTTQIRVEARLAEAGAGANRGALDRA